MTSLADFCGFCVRFESEGFEVADAQYDGKHFGSWSIEVARKGVRARQLNWDGRDGLLIVMVRDQVGDWLEEWYTLDREEQSFERIVARLV